MKSDSIINRARFFTLALSVALLPFSVRFCHLSLLLFLIVCIAEGNFWERILLIKTNPLAWILPLFFTVHLVGVLWSPNAHDAWQNIDKKLAFLLIPPLVVSAKPFSKQELHRIAWIFVGACLAGTILCFANAIVMVSDVPLWNFGPSRPYVELHPAASNAWAYFSYIGLASGIGIHPTYFAFYLLICLAIILYQYSSQRRTIFNFLLITYLVIFIVCLSSRVVILMTIITICIWMFTKLRRSTWIAASVILTVIAITLFINPVARYRNTQEYQASSFAMPPPSVADNPISIRVSLWWLSMKAVYEINPVIGNGTGSVNETIGELSNRYNMRNVLNTSDPHNQVLHTYIALGMIGVTALLASFIVPLRTMFRAKEYFVCVAIGAFFVVGLTESVMELQKGIVPFTLFVALVGNYARSWHFTAQHPGYA